MKQTAYDAYHAAAKKHGCTDEALLLPDNAELVHRRRKAGALGVAAIGGTYVLDLGCGFGDLVPLLPASITADDYIGVDMMRPSVHEARNRYPEHKFRVAGAQAELCWRPARSVSVVVALGVVTTMGAHDAERLVRSMKRVARDGVVISAQSPERYTGSLHAYSPEELSRWVGSDCTGWQTTDTEYTAWWSL